MIHIKEYISPVGVITIADVDGAVAGVWLDGQKYFMGTLSDESIIRCDTPVLIAAAEWLERYFSGECPDIAELPLRPSGNEFRRTVWEVLCRIPYGRVTAYKEIASEAARIMGKERMSAQAVGGAVGHNPISVIIPCHRVIGSDGSLTGYAGGVDIKARLLEHEKADMNNIYTFR